MHHEAWKSRWLDDDRRSHAPVPSAYLRFTRTITHTLASSRSPPDGFGVVAVYASALPELTGSHWRRSRSWLRQASSVSNGITPDDAPDIGTVTISRRYIICSITRHPERRFTLHR
jgi:hypothetical protein